MKDPIRSLLIAGAVAVTTLPAAAAGNDADPATLERLQQQVQTLTQQLQAVQVQLTQMRAGEAAPAPVPVPASPAAQASPTAAAQNLLPQLPAQASMTSSSSVWDKLGVFGYGEINYYHPVHRPDLTTADLARAVFGFSYAFDDRTQFNSEFEIEHAVTSADDAGEFEVEQFYVDRQLTEWASVKAGLFLIPSGLLNQSHEPTHYYGVQRDFVDKLIIPTTWREGGLSLHGDAPYGLSYDIGLVTGINLANWDANPEVPLYQTARELAQGGAAPLQAGHQELSLANAQHLSQYIAINYRGVPGLDVGGSLFTGNAATPAVPEGLPDQRVTLWEGHARYNPGRLDLWAQYARGTISNTAAFNQSNPGASNPEPSKFYGWYLQGAYTVWRHGDYRLTPFVRWERYDMGAAYNGIAPGFTPVPTGSVTGYGPWPQPYDRVWTYGVNFYLNPKLVLKADYQTFGINSDLTRFDLGLGLEF